MQDDLLDTIAAGPGTYLLVLASAQCKAAQVGLLGLLTLQQGYYLYIGSAFGAGGIRSRVKHHARISARPHWHLDYIRPSLSLLSIWYSHDAERHECEWATALQARRAISHPLPGFGASDCHCHTHLFYTTSKPDFGEFKKILQHHKLEKIML